MQNLRQFVCGVKVEWYRDQGRSRGVSWCVRSRAHILRAIVAAQCLPHHVDHPDFEGRFLPDVRIACNMTHGGDFARLIRPHFDRLVKHYAKKWVTANGPVVLKDTVVINGNGTEEYRFNQELVDRCFNDVDAIERWLRFDLGKQDWWDKEPAPFGHRLVHVHGPIEKAAANANAPQERSESNSLDPDTAPVVEHTHYGNGHGDSGSGGHGGYGMGVENGVETWEDRIRESFEATHLAWRYVVEVETAAKALMFGINGTV
ncbi:hypothetical protein K4K50_009086 [Colletotrichum sp. SAR 10_71]|nr:hypothetical protein K4K50_009086 [Colletotrichum sp. SAR 10_71]KAI8217286.1 hypothetical protein K4K53_009335 [Colletotrichum sp. SAR 10_77]